MKKHLFTFLLLGFLMAGCTKDGSLPNQPPETKLSLEAINLTGDDRLNSVVRLTWYGTDVDGWVIGYEISINEGPWVFTTVQDSTFRFSIPPGSDSTDVDFRVRAMDNDSAVDPSPAQLTIPLKNSPPQAIFDRGVFPQDTIRAVATYRWRATDPDGDQTITNAYIKFNDGNWHEIARNRALLSFVIDKNAPAGSGTALLYYDNDFSPQATRIDGVNIEGMNTVYLKVVDIAGAESPLDSTNNFYFRTVKNDFLVIAGQPLSVTNAYLSILNDISLQYDFIDFGVNGGINQPAFWNPTFRLLSTLYTKIFVYSDPTPFTNPNTNESGPLLNFITPAIQRFIDVGGKILVTTSFSNNQDVSPIAGTFPIENRVISPGLVRISNDSTIYPVISGAYPEIGPTNILIGIDPIVKAADAEDFYRGRITRLQGWQGDNLIGVRRRQGNQVTQVFFSVELHQFNKDPQELRNLFSQILINDFN
jgi:hypothetical protein